MKEKIINIKNIVKIMLMVLVIYTMIKSCANARVLTDVELKNYCLNAYKQFYNEVVPENIINNVKTHDFTDWILYMINNEGRYILSCKQTIGSSSNGMRIYLFVYNGSSSNLQNQHPYYSSSQQGVLVNTSYLTPTLYTYELINNTSTTTTGNNAAVINISNNYFYTDTNIWNRANNSYTSIRWASGYYTPNTIFNENFVTSTKWEFIPNSNNTISIPNKTQQFYAMNKGTFNTTLATLQDSSYTDQIMMIIQAYNGTSWEVVADRELYNNTMFISDTFPSQTDGDTLKSQIQVKTNTIPGNCIIVLRAYPNQYIANGLGITEIEEYFYITNNKTIINGNTLDLVGTFSGDTDYENEVNQAINNEQQQTNDNNLQDITDNMNKNDSWWRLQFDNLFTLKSGDFQDLENDIKTKIDFEAIGGISGEIGILNEMKDMRPTDFVISWEPAIWNNKVLIPSGDINISARIRENEVFERVHNITQIIVSAALCWLLVNEFWRTFCILLGIGTEVYEQYQDENEIIESQHETWNYSTGQATISTTKRKGNKSITVTGKAPIRKRLK